MNEEKNKPPILCIIDRWKNRSIIKKLKEIEELKLDIEKAKLEKELREVKD